MASENAKAVARNVIKKVGKGRNVVLGKEIAKQGYGKGIIKNPKKVTDTKSYQEEMTPFVNRLIKHREKVIEAMEGKDLTLEEYNVLVNSLNKFNKDVELLSGRPTDRIGIDEYSNKDEIEDAISRGENLLRELRESSKDKEEEDRSEG